MSAAPVGAMLFSLLYTEVVEASMLLSLMGFSLVSVTCNHTTGIVRPIQCQRQQQQQQQRQQQEDFAFWSRFS